MSAVFDCGPADQCRRFILIAIADNCDDFGFGCPGVEAIAAKACCSTRTVIRQIEILEQEGWLRVVRHLVGRGNGYFLDIAKIGVRLTHESKLSPLHRTLRATQHDKLSHIFLPSRPGDTDDFSGDNPQARQVTTRRGQVTKSPRQVTPDVTLTVEPSIEPPLEPSMEENQQPPTPFQGVELDPGVSRLWGKFVVALKTDLGVAPAAYAGGRFKEIEPGENDFDTCFRDWWLESTCSDEYGGWIVVTRARDPVKTKQGLVKYHTRLDKLLREAFSLPSNVKVRFAVREPTTLNPAA